MKRPFGRGPTTLLPGININLGPLSLISPPEWGRWSHQTWHWENDINSPPGKHRNSYHNFRQLETAVFRGFKLMEINVATCFPGCKFHNFTPPKTNILHLKIDPWKGRFLFKTIISRFQPLVSGGCNTWITVFFWKMSFLFWKETQGRCYVSFREFRRFRCMRYFMVV